MRVTQSRQRTSVRALFFFFNDTATTEIYTLSLHDALPISRVTKPSRTCTRPRLRLRASSSTRAPRCIRLGLREPESGFEATGRRGRVRSSWQYEGLAVVRRV